MKNTCESDQAIRSVYSIQRNLDLITAGLLLTGQVTISRLIVEPGGLALSVGGPLTGIARMEGKFGNKTLSLFIDIGDILLGILLLTDQINVSGVFLGNGRFRINMTGPIFGIPKHEYTLPDIEKVYTQFRWIVTDYLNVDSKWFITN
ncbi:hypothetical protein [Neobacillus soli]|uniref:hypothetical protein n=1 Tax=Neobacillus soli TaxID=220688 RepID=UPI0012EEA5FC|nr:hypothetical protein [Neobacillus soli]